MKMKNLSKNRNYYKIETIEILSQVISNYIYLILKSTTRKINLN